MTSSPDLSERCPSPEKAGRARSASAETERTGIMATATTTAADPAATKKATQVGVTLVAKYKGTDYTCEVVEHDERLHYVLPGRGGTKPRSFTSPSAAGREITGSQVNGYRFWSVPEKPPSGQPARRKVARAAVTAAASAKPKRRAKRSTAADGASEPSKPVPLIERSTSQRGVSEGQARYFCSRCMKSFVADDAGEGKLPEQCPEGHAAA